MKKLTVILVIFTVLLTSCKKNDNLNSLTGIVKAQGVTTYMYGTHILTNTLGQTQYALRSSSVNLDDFINKKVEIMGSRIEGYPIEGGPDYIEVLKVK